MKRDGTADSDGKGAGKNVAALPNPAIDARSAVQLLRNVGFDVVEGADRARMTERLLQFGRRRPSFLPWLGGMIVGAATPVSNPSPERRSANNKSARWARNRTIRQEKIQKKRKSKPAWPCFSHRKDQSNIRDIGRRRRIVRPREPRCPS
jgi:hypothetical protein